MLEKGKWRIGRWVDVEMAVEVALLERFPCLMDLGKEY